MSAGQYDVLMYFYVILLFCLFNIFHSVFAQRVCGGGSTLFVKLWKRYGSAEPKIFSIRYSAGAVRMIDDVADPDAVAWNAVGSSCSLHFSERTRPSQLHLAPVIQGNDLIPSNVMLPSRPRLLSCVLQIWWSSTWDSTSPLRASRGAQEAVWWWHSRFFRSCLRSFQFMVIYPKTG